MKHILLLASVVLALATAPAAWAGHHGKEHGAAKKMEASKMAAVNINQADLKMLTKLPGIGKKKAQAILDYRKANGDFKSLAELKNVKGLGKKALAKLEGKVTF